jgi:Tocopherol cyclase
MFPLVPGVACLRAAQASSHVSLRLACFWKPYVITSHRLFLCDEETETGTSDELSDCLLDEQVTLPEMEAQQSSGRSFALIYSYERGKQPCGADGRVGIQIMGPSDGYIAQTSTDLQSFWGERNSLALGACLKAAPARRHGRVPKGMMPRVRIAPSCTPISAGMRESKAVRDLLVR